MTDLLGFLSELLMVGEGDDVLLQRLKYGRFKVKYTFMNLWWEAHRRLYLMDPGITE